MPSSEAGPGPIQPGNGDRGSTAAGAGEGCGSEATVDLRGAYEAAGIQTVLDQLDRELVGLRPVKARIREIAALLVVNRARREVGLESGPPSLHMSFTGRPGTGKTTVAAALALALARDGKRTLLMEVEGRQGIAQLFDVPPLPYEERVVAGSTDRHS
jgi:Mrp family chromosome partitioning ATPase